MNFSQFLSILRARKWLGLSVFIATIVLTIVVSLVWPKQYTAVSSVVVDIRPDPIAGFMMQGFAMPSIIATQIDVIQSDRVAQRVVRNLKLADNPEIRRQWLDETQGQGSIEIWLGTVFQKNMDVKPSRESNVISLAYKAPDPRFAAGVANAFVQSYIDTTLELRVDPARQYSTFFDVRAKDAREALEKAQTKLSVFQKDNGIIAADERYDIENGRLNELSSQLVMIQALAAESGSRQTQAQGTSGDRLQEVLNSALLGGLKIDLSRAEARLQEFNSKFGDNHPQVVELKANIADLRARIDAETKKVTGGVTVSNTINRSREAQLRADLESQRAKVLKMKALRDDAAVLARDVDSAQRAYDAIQTRLTQTSLESQSTQSYVNVLSPATPPLEPSSPRLVLNSLVAIFLGAVLGLGLILLRELFDRRLRSVTDISNLLGVPTLGTLPKTARAKRLFGKPRTQLLQNRILGQLPSQAKGA